MEFIVRSGSSVNSRRDGQLGEYLYRMSVRILIRILCLLQSGFFSGILNPEIELNNADPNFLGDKTRLKISILKKNKFQKSQVLESQVSKFQISGLKILVVMDSLNFRISSIYYLNIKFSLKIFHFLYLLAATWVLKTGFGIAIVFFFRSLKYDWGSNASPKSIFPTHGTAE